MSRQISRLLVLSLIHISTLQLSDLETGQHPAQRRLILEELLAHNLSMLALRAGAQRFHAQPLSANDALKNKLLAALPFKPTGAQARVVAEIELSLIHI